MNTREIHKLFLKIAKQAYDEGRKHQYDEDFPDVGMPIKNEFSDTEIYKTIMKRKPK